MRFFGLNLKVDLTNISYNENQYLVCINGRTSNTETLELEEMSLTPESHS
ncbi:MAG: hypothetical protein ACFC03_00435 [Candidatus Malihini olakiniferum]